MRVTVIVENEAGRPELRSEHGLALWLETRDNRLLFDTGASDAVVENARILGIDLSTADAIVISHGHCDHAGGLSDVARIATRAAIYAGADVTTPRYSKRKGGLREIGFDHHVMNAVAHRLRVARDSQSLVPGVTVLSDFPADKPLPADNSALLARGDEGLVADPFADEIALVVDTSAGPVVISGCSHRGIGNIVQKAVARYGQPAALIGGFHLHRETDTHIAEMAADLSGIAQIFTGHCTGSHAVDVLREHLGSKVQRFRAGSVMEIG